MHIRAPVRGPRVPRRAQGQAAVELALVLPVLLVLLLGMSEFARMAGAYLAVQHGAREGARLAMTGAGDDEVVRRVRAVAPQLDPARLRVEVLPAPPRASGSDVAVRVAYGYRVAMPVINRVVGPDLTLQAQVTVRVE